jgi:plasmid maintenance system antidote protein VapI
MTLTFERLSKRLLSEIRRRMEADRNMSQSSLARMCGLSVGHFHNVITGNRDLTMGTADKLLTALGISLVELLKDKDTIA